MTAITIKTFIAALLVFFITDMVWLGWLAKSYYIEQYKPWLRLTNGQLQPIWWAAFLVYLLFALSIVVFILPLASGSLQNAAFYGIILGAVIYGVYDFTCLALFKNWPPGMAFVDWVWGMVLCGWGSFITVWVHNYFKQH
ncbi:DUF2177 family protein [Legionella spiritensis]|uniref:Membrane protein n=1 Tax=Legionella spiritensis TaxID=452 RepID=A0A0W0Z0P5_LEGSP|nr:DUF2177 family protein [Legionella spiritensis]KTD62698.1 membrane protein [Legionella spiritensis]SNV31528.1 membrane protein [Legionella spiritensis]VEG92128.1 membrane protein [Legionella spiritensis]